MPRPSSTPSAMPVTLSERIRRDLEHLITSGADPGPLTLEALGVRYQASTRPVRTALAGLLEDGLLVKHGNRRIAIASRPKQGKRAKPTSSAPPPAAPDLERTIAADLVQASLRGHELFLREESAAERYGIGRTVLRRIFLQLAGKGLLEHVTRRGWRVRPFRQSDFDAFLEVREVLELKALDLAKNRLERPHLESMLAGNRIEANRVHLDNRVHDYLLERSENPYLRDFFARHGEYFSLFFEWEAKDARAAREACRQHRALLRALIDRDWDAARQRLVEHIRDTHPVLRSPA